MNEPLNCAHLFHHPGTNSPISQFDIDATIYADAAARASSFGDACAIRIARYLILERAIKREKRIQYFYPLPAWFLAILPEEDMPDALLANPRLIARLQQRRTVKMQLRALAKFLWKAAKHPLRFVRAHLSLVTTQWCNAFPEQGPAIREFLRKTPRGIYEFEKRWFNRWRNYLVPLRIVILRSMFMVDPSDGSGWIPPFP